MATVAREWIPSCLPCLPRTRSGARSGVRAVSRIGGSGRLTRPASPRGPADGGVFFAGNTTTGVIGIKTRGVAFTGAGSLVRQFSKRLDLGAEVFGAVSSNLGLSRGQL